jgi:hypothetical protein
MQKTLDVALKHLRTVRYANMVVARLIALLVCGWDV